MVRTTLSFQTCAAVAVTVGALSFQTCAAVAVTVEELSTSVFDENGLSLLQTRASQSKAFDSANAANPVPGVSLSSNYLFDTCATFGNAADIIGAEGNWKTTADYGLCRCWGDTHCSHVPFDMDPAERGTRSPWMYHYQYNGGGASRYAKAADGSWEVQIWQCGISPSNQVGVAVQVQGTLVEAVAVGAGVFDDPYTWCYVNGEEREPGSEVHLPNGFHFKCPGTNMPHPDPFCATVDGQFLLTTNLFEWGQQLNQNLAVPWSVDVQRSNNVCYDPSSKDNPQINFGRQISETAMVPNEEVIFSQTAIERMMAGGACEVNDPPQTGNPVDPDGTDAQTICAEKHPGTWEHVQAICAPLREGHRPFYEDCLIDECLRADDSEEEDIEDIAQVDENIEGDDSCNIEDFMLNTPAYSNLGNQGPDDGNPEGILYPDAGIINGQPVNVRVTAVGDYQPSHIARNTVQHGLGVVNMLCGTTADLQIKIESQNGDPVSVDALALTIFDLDEGRRGRGRTTVTACGATMSSGGELLDGRVNDCPTATSTTPGTSSNNPTNANGVSEDQRSRSVSFAFGEGSSFPLKIEISRGSRGRNVLFSLRPVVGC